ncbi:MAG TPA: helix-turn-helix domain-containing protein [Spongiibacteraceae bacterium]
MMNSKQSHNMDNFTDLELARALAGLYYSVITGLEISPGRGKAAFEAWSRLTISPWSAQPDLHSDSKAYLHAFSESFRNSGPLQNLCRCWQSKFDRNGVPLSDIDVRGFLTEAISIQLHSSHTHHDFFCICPTFKPDSVVNFPINYPIAADFWTICLTEGGAGYIQAATHRIDLLPGSVALIPPGFHGQVVRCENSPEWRCCYLGFRSRPQWLKLLDWAYPLRTPVVLNSDLLGERDTFRRAFLEISTTSYHRGDINESLCFILIASLLTRFNRLNKKHFESADKGKDLHMLDVRVSAAVNFVINNYSKSLNLETIANHASLSTSRLSAIFKQHYGISLIQWRDSIRLSIAKNLLANTNISVTDISQQVGWADQLYFSRRFKKEFGYSPRNYRRHIRSALIE